MSKNVIVSRKIIGRMVYNAKHDTLGKIKEVFFDAKNEKILYAILSYGGIFGISKKLFAIPLELLRYNDHEQLSIDLNASTLENTPGYDQSKLDPLDQAWQTCIQHYHKNKKTLTFYTSRQHADIIQLGSIL